MNQNEINSDDLLKIDIDDDADNHGTNLQKILSTQWQNGQFCDVRVKYTGGSLDVHACVLYGFCGNLTESIAVDCFDAASKELNLGSHDVIDCGIRPIITYLYTGSLVVKNDPDVLLEVRNCAKLMGLKKIESLCQKYLDVETDVDVTVSFEKGAQIATVTSSSQKSPERTTRKKGRPTKKKKPRPKITEKENGHGDARNVSLNVEVRDTSINVVKEENVSDDDEPQGSGSGRRTRLSNRQTVESLQSILKAEGESLMEIDELEYNESEFKCLNCRTIFGSISEIENHLKTCIEEPKFECDECGREFERQCSLTFHKRLRHTDRAYLQCRKCNWKAKSEGELRTHCKKEHRILKPFFCDFSGCKYAARKYEFVLRHKKIHNELFECMCENCGRAFAQPSGLISHRRACYKSGQYLCDICGRAFNFLISMKTHRLAKHLKEKPHRCEICDARFSDPRNLKRHKRIHENSFPYCCEICGKVFRHSNTMKDHMVKHIGSSRGNSSGGDQNHSVCDYDEVEAATGSLVLPNLPT